MKSIELTQGYVALVDDEDYERVSRHKWCADVRRRKDGSIRYVYAARGVTRSGKKALQHLHRFIMEETERKVQIDHRDHDGLNNQRYNLRSCNQTQNNANQRIGSKNTSGSRGVSWCAARGNWLAQIRCNKKTTNLGRFNDKQEAVAAYQAAAREVFGEFALQS